MPAIGEVGTEITVTPYEGVQMVKGPGVSEDVDDPTPFCLRVEGTLIESEKVIGVFGPVIAGPDRYTDLTATLFLRLMGSNWLRDNRSAGQFKVGMSVARMNRKHPFYHPEGSDMEGYPFFCRYGSLDSRSEGEQEINSAKDQS
ncbi:MAG: hypothetical protein P1U86_18670 [Verrucomicrobiales bacterium]|nr:hypothetical protein [Verrucomicrobiales bacterium]